MAVTTTQTVPTYLPFDVHVTATRRLSPTFVRISLGGHALADFDGGGELGTRDTRVKVVIPPAPGPFPDIDLSEPSWYRTWLARDPGIREHMRTYTVRAARFGGTTPEIDLDFVLHLDGHGSGGPATGWAATAEPGDRLTIIGPNRHNGTQAGIEWQPPIPPANQRTQVLLAGDETALPAIAAILETLSDQYLGDACIEVPSAEDIQDLGAPPGMLVTFLVRGDNPHGELLQAAVDEAVAHRSSAAAGASGQPAVDLDPGILWDVPHDPGTIGTGTSQPFYGWVAGESATVRAIRRNLVQAYGIPRGCVAFMGYWRQGR